MLCQSMNRMQSNGCISEIRALLVTPPDGARVTFMPICMLMVAAVERVKRSKTAETVPTARIQTSHVETRIPLTPEYNI